MGEEITINQLALMNVLSDKQLLEIIRKPNLEKVFLIKNMYDNDVIQILYGQGGWIFKNYEIKSNPL